MVRSKAEIPFVNQKVVEDDWESAAIRLVVDTDVILNKGDTLEIHMAPEWPWIRKIVRILPDGSWTEGSGMIEPASAIARGVLVL